MKKWGFVRETVEAAKKAGIDADTGLHRTGLEEYLSVIKRTEHMLNICKTYKNAIPILIDVSKCRLDSGEEDWDQETPLVRNIVGNELNAVYSSEPSYEDYFNRAYPEAVHRVVDYKRIHYPISGTKIRNMNDLKERDLWII